MGHVVDAAAYIAQAAGCRLHNPALLPVRRGGPWHKDGKFWERWANGEYQNHGAGSAYHVQDGRIWCGGGRVKALKPGDEVRASKGYTGGPPEGCVFLDEDKFKVGDKVRLLWEVDGKTACGDLSLAGLGKRAATVRRDLICTCDHCEPGPNWSVEVGGTVWCWPESHLQHMEKA